MTETSDVPPVIDGDGSQLAPGQAAFRFVIELAAIVCWGIVGWHLTDTALRWVLVVVLPFVAAAVWGTFRAPGDHSANGGAPVAVPGVVRLVIELDVLLGAAVLTAVFWRPVVGLLLGVAVVAHYLTTLPRVRWLLRRRT